VSPCAPFLVDRPSKAPHFSLTDISLAYDIDMCLLDTANPGSVDDSVIKGLSSLTMQIDELQDILPEHVRKLFRLTVEKTHYSCCTHDLLPGFRDFYIRTRTRLPLLLLILVFAAFCNMISIRVIYHPSSSRLAGHRLQLAMPRTRSSMRCWSLEL